MTILTSAFSAKRKVPIRHAQKMRRIIGLEFLERRTVFANDLIPFLAEVGNSVAAPASEAQATELSSNRNSSVEVANSPISLLQGDRLRIEVPESSLNNLTANDSYSFRLSFSQNYFEVVDYSHFAWASGNRSLAADSIYAGNFGAIGSDTQLPNSLVQDQDQTLILASLTARENFDGTLRIFDSVQDDAKSAIGDAADRPPNEVRIEPSVVGATVMRDPGPTVFWTVVVNRQPNGLVFNEEITKKESPTPDESTRKTIDSNPVPQSIRPTIAVRTIDIAQARRHEVARPWLQSSIIQNPANSRPEFVFEKKSSAVSIQSHSPLPSPATNESKLERNTRWNARVSNTQLQPVDFLLAKSDIGIEKGIALERKRILATDAVISSYPDIAKMHGIEPEIAGNPLGLGAMLFGKRQAKTVDSEKYRILRQNSDDESLAAMVSQLRFAEKHLKVASTRESWKNMVRSASESTAGQALLATLSTMAGQQREINAFGTKTAWEFVTKPAQNSPV